MKYSNIHEYKMFIRFNWVFLDDLHNTSVAAWDNVKNINCEKDDMYKYGPKCIRVGL